MRKGIFVGIVLSIIFMCVQLNAAPDKDKKKAKKDTKKKAGKPKAKSKAKAKPMKKTKEYLKYEKLAKDSDIIIEGRVLKIEYDLTPSKKAKIPYWAELEVTVVHKGNALLKKIIVGFPDRVVVPKDGKVAEMKNRNYFKVEPDNKNAQLLFLKKDATDQAYWAKTPDRRIAYGKLKGEAFFKKIDNIKKIVNNVCPQEDPEYSTPYAVIETNYGDLICKLDPSNAKHTVLNFMSLAKGKFYDGLKFHRAVPGYLLQGGKPKGTGKGGPGYYLRNEHNLKHRMRFGALTMLGRSEGKKGMRVVNVINGCQFFVSCADIRASALLKVKRYPVFGQVIKESLPVLYHINNLPTDKKYSPKKAVVIKSIRVFDFKEWDKEKKVRKEKEEKRRKDLKLKLADKKTRPIAVFETDKGTFEFKFYQNLAPETTERIVSLIEDKWYDGQEFYLVKNEKGPYIKTGNPTFGKEPMELPDIPTEITEKVKFDKGIVGLIRQR